MESAVKHIPDEKLLEIYNSRKVELSSTYMCFDSEGEIISSDKAEYEKASKVVAQNNASKVAAQNNSSYNGYVEGPATENSWAKLLTISFQNQNDHTNYLFISSCEWLTVPFWRGKDFHVLYTTEGNIDSSTAQGLFSCKQTKNNITSEVYSEYNSTSANFKSGGRIISFSDNLLNDYINTVSGQTLLYEAFVSMVYVNGTMSDSPYSVPFNVSSHYAHQRLTLLVQPSISISSGIAASFSISPQLAMSNINNNINVIHKM